MALSGSLNTKSYDGRYYKLSWTATQSIADNQSTVNWSIEALGGNSSYYAERTLKVVIAGSTVYSKTDRVLRYEGVIASGKLTLNHDSSGKKSFDASVEAAVYVANVNCTGSASFTLNQIPRKATITSAPNFNDEQNPKINYSNLAGNNVTSLRVCISLDGSKDDIAYRSVSKTGTEYTFQLTDAERKVLRDATTGSNSRTVRFYIETVMGGETYRHYLAKTFTIINGSPVLSPMAVDVGSISTTLTGDNNIIIKGYNVVEVSMSAQAQKGASIQSRRISCGGKSIISDSGSLPYVESGTFVFSATDNRGNTTTQTIEKTLIEYFKPTCNLDISAPTADGKLNFTVSGKCFSGSFGATNNTVTVEYRYKGDDDTYTEWKAATATLSNNTYNAYISLTDLDYQQTYTFQARAIDKINSATSAESRVKTTPIFDWGESDFKFNVPVTYLDKKLFYTAGDTVTMTDAQICFSGFVSNGQKQLYVTIPISKPIFATGVKFEGAILCRSINGYINGTTYNANTSIDLSGNAQGYTIRKYLNEVGITLIIDFTSTITNTTANNVPISATPYGTLKITFS